MDTAALTTTYLRMAWRKRWFVVVPLFLSMTGAAAVLHYMPPEYKATTMILVEPPNIPLEYVKPTATTSIVSWRAFSPTTTNRASRYSNNGE